MQIVCKPRMHVCVSAESFIVPRCPRAWGGLGMVNKLTKRPQGEARVEAVHRGMPEGTLTGRWAPQAPRRA